MTAEEATTLTAHATSPWAERPFVAETPLAVSPPPECDSCPFPDCAWNGESECPAKKGRTKVGRGRKKSPPNELDYRALNYIKGGAREAFICRELGISKGQLRYEKQRLKRLGLY